MNEEMMLKELIQLEKDIDVIHNRINVLIKMHTMTEVEEKVITTPSFKKLPRTSKITSSIPIPLGYVRVYGVVKMLKEKAVWIATNDGVEAWAPLSTIAHDVKIGSTVFDIKKWCYDKNFANKNVDDDEITYPKAPENTELP